MNTDDQADLARDESSNLDAPSARYVETIVRLRARAQKHRTFQDRMADAITGFSGRMIFVYVHVVWFGAWILLNTGILGNTPFDPFPYGLLTMIVSLEAIFLSSFIMITQNRMSTAAEHRADLDLHIDLLAEYELTRVIQMLDAIQRKLGIQDDDTELAELKSETKPEDILAEIERLHQSTLPDDEPSEQPDPDAEASAASV
jgi:uncharacterized membrane protein